MKKTNFLNMVITSNIEINGSYILCNLLGTKNPLLLG